MTGNKVTLCGIEATGPSLGFSINTSPNKRDPYNNYYLNLYPRTNGVDLEIHISHRINPQYYSMRLSLLAYPTNLEPLHKLAHCEAAFPSDVIDCAVDIARNSPFTRRQSKGNPLKALLKRKKYLDYAFFSQSTLILINRIDPKIRLNKMRFNLQVNPV